MTANRMGWNIIGREKGREEKGREGKGREGKRG